MEREDLIIQAIVELKDDVKSVNKEIHTMSVTIASLANVQSQLAEIKADIKDYPMIRLVVKALVAVVGMISAALISKYI